MYYVVRPTMVTCTDFSLSSFLKQYNITTIYVVFTLY